MTARLQSSVPPEILFIERCVQLLRDGGRIGIVLPDSILGSPGLGYIREWLIRNTRIVASLDLHADTFQPRNGTQTSVLILQKKTQAEKDREEKSGTMADYNIFMAMVEKVGHDKRGNPLFMRDKEGNEILGTEIAEDGKERKVKQFDDETSNVPELFVEWKRKEGIAW
jgi:type I restriction enzyme M protein